VPRQTLPRKRLPAAIRREWLLAAAAEQFGARGYTEASLRDIAAAAGVSTPALYDHFKSKADLYAEVAWEQADVLLACWSARLTGSAEDIFREIIDRIFAWIDANSDGSRILFADAPGDPLVAETITAVQDRAADAVARLIASQPTPKVPDQLARERANAAVAKLALSAVDGLAAWWSRNPDVPRSTVVALARDVLWGGLRNLTQEETST
jgi:AcrR family transcriptional regulator